MVLKIHWPVNSPRQAPLAMLVNEDWEPLFFSVNKIVLPAGRPQDDRVSWPHFVMGKKPKIFIGGILRRLMAILFRIGKIEAQTVLSVTQTVLANLGVLNVITKILITAVISRGNNGSMRNFCYRSDDVRSMRRPYRNALDARVYRRLSWILYVVFIVGLHAFFTAAKSELSRAGLSICCIAGYTFYKSRNGVTVYGEVYARKRFGGRIRKLSHVAAVQHDRRKKWYWGFVAQESGGPSRRSYIRWPSLITSGYDWEAKLGDGFMTGADGQSAELVILLAGNRFNSKEMPLSKDLESDAYSSATRKLPRWGTVWRAFKPLATFPPV
ncbi:hypothetical protein BD779DRAFT_1478965 [Infundibulicybe gibba]|nr:hypothetical protein BD779DRAFT_1478965 [Infundibulicybe gibba]